MLQFCAKGASTPVLLKTRVRGYVFVRGGGTGGGDGRLEGARKQTRDKEKQLKGRVAERGNRNAHAVVYLSVKRG